MNVELLDAAGPAWRDVLARCRHDCHHTSGWLKACEHGDGGTALAVHVRGGRREGQRDEQHDMLVPLVRRELASGDWDATSPYGYAGPVFSDGAPDGFADDAVQAALSFLREQGCVSWFIRLHPLINDGWRSRHGLVVEHGPTVSIDLRKSPEEHWRETQSRHKLGINRARRAGVTVRMDSGFEAIPQFIDIYNRAMDRLGASGYYYFGQRYYEELVDRLGDALLLFVAEEAGRVIGGAMFTLAPEAGIMQYHLSAADNDFRHRQPAKMIIHAAREWGREHGFSRLHLGGGLGSQQDSLFEFKRGFSTDTHMFRTQRLVVDAEKYVALSGGEASVLEDLGGFFPAYRCQG